MTHPEQDHHWSYIPTKKSMYPHIQVCIHHDFRFIFFFFINWPMNVFVSVRLCASWTSCLTLCVSCPAAAGEKAIVCDQCGAQFQTEESLEAHRQIHTGTETHKHTPHTHCATLHTLSLAVVSNVLGLRRKFCRCFFFFTSFTQEVETEPDMIVCFLGGILLFEDSSET